MGDDISSGEEVVLLFLRSVNRDKINTRQLQSIGIKVHEFDDADEYVQYLVSLNTEDIFVFVWLGFGWNHLIVTLHDYEHVHCIYLSEPAEVKDVPKVRGVFSDGTKLLEQVLVDARACQLNQSTHLNVVYNQEMATIQNPNGTAALSMWSQVLLQTLIRMPTPTTDVYREMIDEARYFYRNNPAQIADINHFEQKYRAEDAIRWYSRDSFVYRLVNKALRVQNFAIIFKFRCFIRDVYEQLKKLHHEQNLTEQAESPIVEPQIAAMFDLSDRFENALIFGTGQQSTITLYRAMKVSSIEGNRLRSCNPGTILSINSFVSTSLSSTVATMYLGADPERDIMLEILIDKSLLNSDSSPFADIRAFSSFSDEEEVLLSMGTTLQVQSVTSNSEQENIYIYARLCYEDDATVKELKTYLLEGLEYEEDESTYISILSTHLWHMSDYKKLEEIMKLPRTNTENVINKVSRSLIRLGNATQNSSDEDGLAPCILAGLSAVAELFQDLGSDLDLPNDLQHLVTSLVELLRNVSTASRNSSTAHDPEEILEPLLPIIPFMEQLFTSLSPPSSHPVWSQLHLLRSIADAVQGKHTQALEHFETGRDLSNTSFLNDNSLLRRIAMIMIADSAATLGDDDRSMQILEDLCTSEKPSVMMLFELATNHRKHGGLSMAIECYRRVIEECSLAPNSIEIVKAYISIGAAFTELNDNELALTNYCRARDLLLQHHQPTHPLLTQVQTCISHLESLHQIQELPGLELD